MKRLIVLMMVGGIAGCGSQPLVRPETGQKVTIEFVNGTPSSGMYGETFHDDYDCYSRDFVTIYPEKGRATVVLEKRPYQTVYFQYLGVTTGWGGLQSITCGGTVTFPTGDSDRFQVTTMNRSNSCGVVVSRPDASSRSGWSRVPYTRRATVTPFYGNGAWCKPEEAFKGSSVYIKPRGT